MQIVCIYLKAFIDYYNIYKSAYPDSERWYMYYTYGLLTLHHS